ncbi:MAG: hypothetical protein E3K32_06990 [wastewater metagenome]|nr:hypothetical protein [Candidatus Loosdrechtia aerotolerans]
MKKIASTCFILFLCYLFLIQKNVYGYGYAREKDPLITVFRSVIFYGRQSNWSRVAAEINTINNRITDIYTIFKIDLKPRIESAIQQQDFQALANYMANFVFLAIREKFYYNRQEKLEIFIRSKVRLRLAEEYYSILLAGNVRNYDIRHKTNLHEKIYNRFIMARDTLGSMGFLGVGAIKPDLKNFEITTKEIETLLVQAFPYFETGQFGSE